MKYDFEGNVSTEINRQVKEEMNRQVKKIGDESDMFFNDSKLREIDKSSEEIRYILKILNNSHYPEFKGLRLVENSVEAESTGYSISAKFTLVNYNNEMYDVVFNRSYNMTLSDSEQKLVVKFSRGQVSWNNEMNISFVIGNDVVNVSLDRNGYDIIISVYTDAAGYERLEGKPVELVPDFKCKIPRKYRDGNPYYDPTDISEKMYAEEVSLYTLRKIATRYLRKCHEMLDDLELYPEERTR